MVHLYGSVVKALSEIEHKQVGGHELPGLSGGQLDPAAADP
jgi:hypothetical protein